MKMEMTLNTADWYMKLLAPLSPDVKLDLISRLSESLKEKKSVPVKKAVGRSEDFFSDVSGAWDDGTSVDEEMCNIRESRMSNQTRKIANFDEK